MSVLIERLNHDSPSLQHQLSISLMKECSPNYRHNGITCLQAEPNLSSDTVISQHKQTTSQNYSKQKITGRIIMLKIEILPETELMLVVHQSEVDANLLFEQALAALMGEKLQLLQLTVRHPNQDCCLEPSRCSGQPN